MAGQMNRRKKTREEAGSLLDQLLDGSGLGSIRKQNEQARKDNRRKKGMESVPGIETSRTRAAETKRKADDVKRTTAATKANRTADKVDAFMKEVEAEPRAKSSPKSSGGTYKIKKGDTLSEIAKSKGTTVKALAEKNNIKDPDKIFAGDSLKLNKGGMTKKPVPQDNPGLKKLPTEVRNKMGYMSKGGMPKKYNKGGYANCGASMKPAQKSSQGNK